MDVSQFYQTWLHLTVEPGTKPDFYQLLEIPTSEENADRIQVAAERRFHQLDQVDFHAHLPEYRTILQHIMEAEMTLKTPSLRRKYDAERTNTTYIDPSIYEYTKPGLLVRIRQWAFITLFVIAGVGVAAYMGFTVERNPDGSVKFASATPVVKKQVPFTRAPGKEFPRPNTKPKQLGISRLERPSAKAGRTDRTAGENGLAGTNSTGNGTSTDLTGANETGNGVGTGLAGMNEAGNGAGAGLAGTTGLNADENRVASNSHEEATDNALVLDAGLNDNTTDFPVVLNETPSKGSEGRLSTGKETPAQQTAQNTASSDLDESFEFPEVLPSEKTEALESPSSANAVEAQLPSAGSSVAENAGETAGTAEVAVAEESEETDLSQMVPRTRPRLRDNSQEPGPRVSPLQTAYIRAQQAAADSNDTTVASNDDVKPAPVPELPAQPGKSVDSDDELAVKTNIVSNITDELRDAQKTTGSSTGIFPAGTARDGRSGGTLEQPSVKPAQVAKTGQRLPVTESGKALPPEYSEWKAQLADAMKEVLVSQPQIEKAQNQAKELCEEAAKSSAHDAGCYNQYHAALRLACKAQDITLAFCILDQMNETFEMDLVQEKTQTALLLAESLNKTGASLKDKQPILDLVRATAEMSNEINKAGLYQDSKNLYDLVYQAVANSFLRKPQYQKMALQKKEHAAQVARFYESFEKAQKTLETEPENANANMKCALWICQMENDFDKAIPYFAKCGQKKLSDLAADELSLSSKGDSNRILQLADSWWELAHQIPKPLNELVYAHALSLYQRLDRSVLANGEQARVAERIEKLRKTL